MLYWSSKTAYQCVNQGPVKGNAVCKCNHDVIGKVEETVKLDIMLDPKDIKGVQDVVNNTGNTHIKLISSLMTGLFEGSNIEELM